MRIDWILLLSALALFGWSLLVVRRAPVMPLFFMAVAATEFGNFLAVPALLVGVFGFSLSLVGVLTGVLSLGAAALFLSPSVQSWRFVQRTGLRVTLSRAEVVERRIDFAGERHVDCFYQAGVKNAPLVVVVHGGGWEGGDTREGVDSLKAMARLGVVVASVSYGLVPQTVWPGQRDDVLENIRDFRALAGEFGFDPERIYIFGRSAGGQIASAVACSGEVPGLRGCICVYAPFDMLFAYELSREDDILRSPRLVRRYLGGTPDVAHENYLTSSAYHMVDDKTPPFLLLHGTRDELVWMMQSRRFADKLREHGVPVEYFELPWARHAFDYFPKGAGGKITLAAMQRFIFQERA